MNYNEHYYMDDFRKYKRIEDISKYVMDGIEKGTLLPIYIRKVAKVHARVGIFGEIIRTIAPGQVNESINIVKMDEDGLLDIVITNKSNEQYVIPAKLFFERYDKDPNGDNLYIPKGIPLFAVKVFENIEFKVRWGVYIRLKTNGYIVIRSTDDIYALQEDSYKESYENFDPRHIDSKKFIPSDNYFTFDKSL